MEETPWIEKKLANGDTYHLREFIKEKKQPEQQKIQNSDTKPIITINKIRNPISIVVILLTQEENLVGYVESHVFENKKANIHAASCMSQILEEKFGIKQEGFPAIYTDEKYRGTGKGTILLELLFEYLAQKGVKSVDVEGIVNEGALQFYEKSGAKKIDDKTAVFEDIENILQNLQKKKTAQINYEQEF